MTFEAAHTLNCCSSGIIQVDKVTTFVQYAFFYTQPLNKILIANHIPRIMMETGNCTMELA